MLNLRHNLVIGIFFALCIGAIVLSSMPVYEFEPVEDTEEASTKIIESYFNSADYYLIGKDADNFHLYSSELIHNQTKNELILTSPNGVFFSDDGDPMYYSGGSGFYDIDEGKLFLKENVILRSRKMTINSDEFNYDDKLKTVLSRGNVFSKTTNYDDMFELVIESEALRYFHLARKAQYSGNVRGKMNRFRKYEAPFYFNSDRLTLLMDDKKAEMDGNVAIQKQGLRANSRRGEVFLENYNKKLKYFALFDDVIVKEKVAPENTPPFERRAYSERLEGFTSEGMVVLLGSPKVYQKKDVLKGNVIILRENNETIEVDDANTNFKLR
ncbi:LptA/OstA family protein [Bacteriovorax sp. Seq25_V]|uniref:LptA/OstA family protein n=1 Tax=Bacteriovorax sp. Seq25_V TaxID=1201288 RepID=UPI00038A36FD|nr:LptA/OstA family protein [Bacteriovorax sp. Seq25_V]EQC45466.1 OstA-like protein [Bacteriovorax sp. Seq25_V]